MDGLDAQMGECMVYGSMGRWINEWMSGERAKWLCYGGMDVFCMNMCIDRWIGRCMNNKMGG